MRALLISLFVTAVAFAAFEADISGQWTGSIEVNLPDGSAVTQPAWAEFHQKILEISGTAGGGDSDESLPIEKGILDGKKVAFQFTGLDGRVYKASLALTSEDSLEGKLDFTLPDGSSMTARLVLKREKPH